MAEENDKLSFSIDLDAKEMMESLVSIKEQIASLGEAKNLTGLVEGLTEASKLIGVVGVALLAVKTSFETVFEAEKIRQVNLQFDALAKSAGVAGDALREGLVEASHGLADDTDILQAANKALVTMGENAGKLPEIMELARKSTAVMGGDLVSNFDRINHAIAAGSDKQLKALGLHVDVKKAIDAYADSLGVTSNSLSETGKKQAVLNAVLESGKQKFKDVNESVLEANNTWKQIIVTFKNVAEVATLAFEKTVGPSVRGLLKDVSSLATQFKTLVVANFGEGVDKAVAKSELLEKEYTSLFTKMGELNQTGQTFFNGTWVTKGSALAAQAAEQMNKRMEQIRSELGETTKVIKEAHKEAEAISDKGPDSQPDMVDKKKVAQEQAKFQQDLVRMHEEAIRSQLEATKSWSEKESLYIKQVELEEEKHAARKKQIAADENLNARQKNELLLAEEQAYQAKVEALEVNAQQRKQQMLQEQMRMTTDFDQFEKLIQEQKDQARAIRDQQQQMIDENKAMTDEEKRQRQLEIEMQFQAQITQIQQQAYADREAMQQRWVYSSNNAAEQFARGFASASMKAQNELMNFGRQGQMVFGMFTNSASNAFMQLGEGSKKGSQIMREAMLGMIADIAQYYGQMMLAAGIFPPNPAALAAGAGLLVLAGFLRSQARGKAGGSFGSVGTVGGGGDIGGVPSTFSSQEQMKENQKQAKSVSLVVQGNIFDSDVTRQRITELVRQSVDATDFSIQRVGGGI